MKYMDFKGITLYQMETCVTIARYKSITKAAEILHTSQPALSKKITQIEDELGLILFIRGKNTSLRTTSAGQYLCDEWDRLLSEFRISFSSAMGLQECKTTDRVVVVTTPSAQPSLFLTPVVSEFRKNYPNIELRVDNCAITEAKKRLLDGSADVVMVPPFLKDIFEVDELKCQMIVRCPLSVGMLKSNPLTMMESVTVEDLATQKFVLPRSTSYIKYITEICEKHGFIPRVSYYTKYFYGISMSLGTSEEVFITDRFSHAYYNENCAYFDLPDTESGIMMSVRRHEFNKYAERFALSAIRNLQDDYLPCEMRKPDFKLA